MPSQRVKDSADRGEGGHPDQRDADQRRDADISAEDELVARGSQPALARGACARGVGGPRRRRRPCWSVTRRSRPVSSAKIDFFWRSIDLAGSSMSPGFWMNFCSAGIMTVEAKVGSASRSRNWVMYLAPLMSSDAFFCSALYLEVSASLCDGDVVRVGRQVGVLAPRPCRGTPAASWRRRVLAALGQHEAVDRRLDRVLRRRRVDLREREEVEVVGSASSVNCWPTKCPAGTCRTSSAPASARRPARCGRASRPGGTAAVAPRCRRRSRPSGRSRTPCPPSARRGSRSR